MPIYGNIYDFGRRVPHKAALSPQPRLFRPVFAEPKIMQNSFYGPRFPITRPHCHCPQKPLVEAAIIRLVSAAIFGYVECFHYI